MKENTIQAYQSCRVCGVHVPAGFTNCDLCYNRSDKVRAQHTKSLQNPFLISEILKPILRHIG